MGKMGKTQLWLNETFGTIEECIQDAKQFEREDGKRIGLIHIGETEEFVPRANVGMILDEIEGEAINQCGEAGIYWIEGDLLDKKHREELQEEIDKAIHAWLRKHGRYPKIYAVKNIKKYDI